jgi:UDP-N-acetylglucosamine 1-carboxyvinyltransferase
MDTLLIDGGRRLRGEVEVAGAKNAALPLLAAALLVPGRSTFRNVPLVDDVAGMKALLRELGARVSGQRAVQVDATRLTGHEASYERVRGMRASVLALGPLLAREGQARVALPGGCTIGPRPIDQHLKGLEALGARLHLDRGTVVARARRLEGATIVFDVVTVTGTENLMMAAALARGRTTLENAACEPEVEELARVLNKMGARIQGAGTSLITIEGVDELHPVDHALVPDRIEAGTLMVAAAITRGDVLVRDCQPEHLDAVLAKLRGAGAEVSIEPGGVRVRGRKEVKPADVATRPHPGFPTDLQAQFMVLTALARGQSVLTETIFESRFLHVPELVRMGADIVVEGRTAIVRGPCKLAGTKVVASDLRASASLVLAGLIAEGTTEVQRVHHLDRGYEGLDRKLGALGASIRRVRAGRRGATKEAS